MIVELGGLTFDSQASGATRLKLTNLGGWYSSPGVRTEVVDIPLADGAFSPIRSYRSPRRMTIEGVATAQGMESAITEVWQALAALLPNGDSDTLYVTDETGRKRCRVWLDGAPIVVPFAPGRARFQVPVVAPDPRKYSDPEVILSEPSGSAADGLTFPLFAGGYLDFGTFSPTGIFYVTNDGTAETWPVFEVRGGIDGDGFEILSDDAVLRYEAAVGAGTVVTLSPYAGGRATSGGQDVTANLTESQWPSLLPGQTRLYVFNPLGVADANALLTATVSKAWW
jgi:hypothetical protein